MERASQILKGLPIPQLEVAMMLLTLLNVITMVSILEVEMTRSMRDWDMTM